jgi:hypothetical protein
VVSLGRRLIGLPGERGELDDSSIVRTEGFGVITTRFYNKGHRIGRHGGCCAASIAMMVEAQKTDSWSF